MNNLFATPRSRVIDAIDRIADALCADIEPSGDRITDACERVAAFLGAEIKPSGNRLADALEAIAQYLEDTKYEPAASVSDIINIMYGDEDNVRIALSEDIALDSPIGVPAGKSLTLDLGGNTVSGQTALQINGDVVLKNGTVECTSRPVIVQNGGSFTLDGANVISTTDCAIAATGAGSKVVVNSGTVTAQEVPVLVTTGASAVINGGTLTGVDNFAVGGNGTPGQGEVNVVMNGGELVGHIQSNGYIAAGVYMPNSGTFTMNGGKITSDGAGIVMRGGQVNLLGGEITATGASGVVGKVGDSRVVVGPYAVVYDSNSKYPAVDTLELNIGEDMVLSGTDGDIQILLSDGATANINDNRN